MKRVLCVAVLLFASAFVHAQGVTDLMWKPKAGDLLVYRLQLLLTQAGQNIEFRGELHEKVLKVEASGEYEVESSQTHGEALIDGKSNKLPDDKPTNDRYNVRGRRISKKSKADEDNPLTFLDTITESYVPEKAVKPGERWTHSEAADAKEKRAASKVEFELVGKDKLGTQDAIRVNFDFKETSTDTPAVAEGWILLDANDYSLLSFNMKARDVKLGADPTRATVVIKLAKLNSR